MEKFKVHKINTISEFHTIANLPKPEHPLISLIDYSKVEYQFAEKEVVWIQGFYTIGLKRNVAGKFVYGQQIYDFNEGLLTFIASGQRIQYEFVEQKIKPSGWLLVIHPDFLWNTPLAKQIKQYDFFGYAVNEALFLSEKEENVLINVMRNIELEYHSVIDKFSQNIIIAQVEVLLNYAERFYQRQFITRKITNHHILGQFEDLLSEYLDGNSLIQNGLPSVNEIASKLNISPNYLGNLLKSLTGQNTQQHIQDKIVEKAKEKLSTTVLSISEIAFDLGFEHSQSFSRFFKNKSGKTPVQFRMGFN